MKRILIILISLFVTSSFNTITKVSFAQKYPFKTTYSYLSDRDNLFPNGFGANFTLKDGYLYILIDTGNTGVLKLSKIISGWGYHDNTEYYDDNIEWSICFGNFNEYYLRTKHLVYNWGNNIRLVLIQKEDEENCRVRIVDVNPSGEIISNKLLGLVFGSDLKLAENPLLTEENFGEVLTGIYTVKTEGEKSFVKLVQFNTDGELLKTFSIIDEEKSLLARDLAFAENGEIGVVSIFHTIDCYWGYWIHLFDSNFNLINREYANGDPDDDSSYAALYGQVNIWRGYGQNGRVWKHIVQLYDRNFTQSIRQKYDEFYFNYNMNKWEFFRNPPFYVASNNDKPRTFFSILKSFLDTYPEMTYYFYHIESRVNLLEVCSGIDTNYPFSKTNLTISTPFVHISYYHNLYPYGVKCYNAKIRSVDSVYILMSRVGNTKHSETPVTRFGVEICFYDDFPTTIDNDERYFDDNTYYSYSGDYAYVTINNSKFQHLTVELFDVLGNKISENVLWVNNSRIYIPISALPSGIYFYRIKELNMRGKFAKTRW